jgi:large subunit ribosomal protein L6
MSRVGEKPIEIPSGVTVKVEPSLVAVKGGQGELSMKISDFIKVETDDKAVTVTRADDTRESKSFHGMTRSMISNMIEGVSKGFSKELEIQGVGFKAVVQGQKLSLSLGFASPVEYTIPEGVNIKVDNNTAVTVTGPDKQQVGDVAARIRSFFPAEPYKGKGVRYKDEHVRRKVGKTVA